MKVFLIIIASIAYILIGWVLHKILDKKKIGHGYVGTPGGFMYDTSLTVVMAALWPVMLPAYFLMAKIIMPLVDRIDSLLDKFVDRFVKDSKNDKG